MPFGSADFAPRFGDIFYEPDFSPSFTPGGSYQALTITWLEWNGSQTPGTAGGTAVSTLNFGDTDGNDIVSDTWPTTHGTNSYAKYIKVQFSGSFIQISNAKIWKAQGAYVTGESMVFSGNIGMAAPATADVTGGFGVGVTDIPVSSPASNLVLVPGATTDSILPNPNDVSSSPGYYSGSRTSLMTFQVQTTVSTPAGPTNLKTFAITYDRY